MKLLEENRPDIVEAVRISREILMILNRIAFRFANLDIEVKPTKVCIGKTDTHEICVEDATIHMYPFYDPEESYQYPEFIIDLTINQCYEMIDQDTKFRIGCEDPLHFILNLDKKELEQRIKKLRVLKMLLENFLENIEFVYVYNTVSNP